MTTDQAQPIAKASERGAATRSALLAAAREVFTTEGYAQAAVTDIVNRAGARVGSLYHHFSGKADRYLTLHDELNHDQVERTRRAPPRSWRWRPPAAAPPGATGVAAGATGPPARGVFPVILGAAR